ncbi:MAG: hypothetical protein KF901_31215 [Myxococcales bacterium]|nr:hypothetical protein [Myxococcales bacterium]
MAQPPSIPPAASAGASTPGTTGPTLGKSRPPSPSDEGFVRDTLARIEDREQQAFLHWRLGALAERSDDPAGAVKAWLQAYNLAPKFQSPLFDLIRVFERRRSFKNLQRLYDAALKSVDTPSDRASARLDMAWLCEDRLDQPAEALEHLSHALDELEADPSPRAESLATVGLAVERAARMRGDGALVVRALEAQVRAAEEPIWRTLLLLDLAEERAHVGEVDRAFETSSLALETGAARYRCFEALEHLARRENRPDALLRALDGIAGLAAEAASGQRDEGSGAFSIERFADATRAAGRAVAAWLEAASVALHRLGDRAGAAERLERAAQLRPSDLVARAMLVEALGAVEPARVGDAVAQALAADGTTPELAAGLRYQAALAARAMGAADAETHLREALALAPDSIVLRCTLDAWLAADARFDEWVEALASREGSDDERASALWRAGTLAAEALGDPSRAMAFFAQAAERAASPGPILLDQLEVALSVGDADVAADAISTLLASELAPEERSALLRERVKLLARAAEQEPTTQPRLDATVEHALGLAEAALWAPDDARTRSARGGRMALLAKAHRALAAQADEDELAAAHLAAAGRAFARAGDDEAATASLREALERVPGHRYAVAMLEVIYRARGDAEAVVALLREAAEAHGGTRAALVELLLAGAAAEAAGDARLAADTYEEAADRQPDATSPLWALERLAFSTHDDALLLRAREGLSERELSTAPGRATLELGEQYERLGKIELAEGPLRACLEGPLALEAAVALATLPEDRVDPSARVVGLERLLVEARGGDVARLSEELGGTAATSDLDPARAEELARALTSADRAREDGEGPEDEEDEAATPESVWGLLHQLLTTTADARFADRADLFLRLAELTRDAGAASALTLHGLRAKLTEGAAASDDAFLLAQELSVIDAADDAHAATLRAEVAIATDETLAGGDDPDARAEALLGRLEHAAAATSSTLRAAAGRALAAASRGPEALETLREVLADEPDDLASWEALRVAARDVGAWADVARACDVLADALDGEPRHALLEESAAVWMDHLGRPDEAERRLVEVTEADRSRALAYHRLHDLLADRGDTAGLLGLVRSRIDAIDDSEQLERLIYEQSRLHRSLGQLDEALVAIDDLLLLDEGHVGAIALAVEIRVQREQWPEAADALRRLARSDVPTKQKRIAHLGAADLLQHRLADPASALLELDAVVAIGLADAALHERRAELAMLAGAPRAAAAALLAAAEGAPTPDRLARTRQAARVLEEHVGDLPEALEIWQRALALVATDLVSGEAVARLLPAATRRDHAKRFEASVRAQMAAEGVDAEHLRRLRAAARWGEDPLMEQATLHALQVLALADDDEARASEEITSVFARPTLGALSEGQLSLLRAPADGGAELELARLVHEDLLEAVGLDFASLGVGRADQVSPKRPHPVRDELATVARLFALELEELYVGGNDPRRLVALPGRRGATWVAGAELSPPLGTLHRFIAGQQAYAAARGVTPLVRRTPEDGAVLLLAACAASDTPLLAGRGKSAVTELAQRLARTLPRKTRKAIAALAPTLPEGGVGLVAFCRDARRSAMRAGLLVAGDLGVVLEALLDEPPRLYSVRASGDAHDLLHYWISPAMLELRRGLGA